jgi:hypothetical protein
MPRVPGRYQTVGLLASGGRERRAGRRRAREPINTKPPALLAEGLGPDISSYGFESDNVIIAWPVALVQP